MQKEVKYVYLGTNGTIISSVHLEDTYYTRRYQLYADQGKKLTKDGIHFFKDILIGEDELEEWTEVNE